MTRWSCGLHRRPLAYPPSLCGWRTIGAGSTARDVTNCVRNWSRGSFKEGHACQHDQRRRLAVVMNEVAEERDVAVSVLDFESSESRGGRGRTTCRGNVLHDGEW